jgi:uncharacterized protein (TIGR03085 family)
VAHYAGAVTNFARTERAALADLLDEVGPDAPTLDAGWKTIDLALHLVIRERVDPAQLADASTPLSGYLQKRRRSILAENGYTGLVEKFRNGPPRFSPFAVPGVDARANTVENFVHHEDVRRAVPDFTIRTLPNEFEGTLFASLTTMSRLILRHCSAGVDVVTPDGRTATLKKGDPAATLTGKPSELILYLYGRRAVADVQISGDNAAREALAHAKLGV